MKVNKEEILSKLLKDKFEKKLLTLEQHSETHLKCIQGTMSDTNKITETCIMLYKEVLKHKNENNERHSMKHTSKSVQKGRNIPNKTKLSIYNTNYSSSKLRNSVMTVKKTDYNKKLCPSKSNGDLLRFKKKNTKMKGIPKNKSCSNLTTAYRCGDNNNNNNSHCQINNSINKQYKKVLHTYTNNNNNTASYNVQRNKTPRLTRTSRQSKDLSNVHKKQRNNNINNNNDNIRGNKKNIHTISHTKLNKAIPIQNNDDNDINNDNIHNQSIGNISNILTIETNLQSDLILNKEDSLLFLPISDIDIPDDKNNYPSNTILTTTTTPSPLYEHFITYFSSIVKYLSIYDLTPLALVNKTISTNVYTYIKQSIESDINAFTAFISHKHETPSQPALTQPITIHISKGTSKASMLLNGPVLNKIFLHKNELPHIDSLRIFKIYFTLINHDISRFVYDNHLFWEKTCDYFINSDKQQLDSNNNDSKIGSLVLNTVNNNLRVKYSAIYKVIRFIKGNESKILPGYFSKKCGTTGLFAFFVKDILDAYGLHLSSNVDDDIPNETYLTYVNIIQLLKEYIDYLNKKLII